MLVVAWCCTMGAWAYDFEADGIYYGITSATDKTVEVVSGSAKYSGDVTIPATVTYGGITYRVTAIGGYAFDNCSSLASITLPESLSSIGNYAFSGCSSLASIVIPEGVTSIGNDTFRDCSSLQSIDVVEDNANYKSIDGVLFNKNVTMFISCPGGKAGARKPCNGWLWI